jgi:hypothetical protein
LANWDAITEEVVDRHALVGVPDLWQPSTLWKSDCTSVDLPAYLHAATQSLPEHRRLLHTIAAALAGTRDPVYSAWERSQGDGEGNKADEDDMEDDIHVTFPEGVTLLPPSLRRQWLEQRSPIELVLCDLMANPPNFGGATGRVRGCLDKFLSSWKLSSSVAASSKHGLLRPLQRLVDVRDFLHCREMVALARTGSRTPASVQRSVDNLMRTWAASRPSPVLDPLDTWESVIHTRRLCLHLLGQELQTAASASVKSVPASMKNVCNFVICFALFSFVCI